MHRKHRDFTPKRGYKSSMFARDVTMSDVKSMSDVLNINFCARDSLIPASNKILQSIGDSDAHYYMPCSLQ